VALVVQHESACAILSSVPASHYGIFPHYLINDEIFEKKVVEYKMCVQFLYSFCLKHFSF